MWTLLFGALAFSQVLSFSDAIALAPATPAALGAVNAHERRRAEASGMRRVTENPVIGVQPGFRNIQYLEGGTGAEVYATLTQRIRLTRQGEKRKASVRSELSHDRAAALLALRDARAAIARAWFARWTGQQSVAIAAKEVSLAAELLARMQIMAAAGEATQVDVAQVEAWQAEAALFELQMEGAAFDSGVELARRVGDSRNSPLSTVDDLPLVELPAVGDLRANLSKPTRMPNVVVARAAREADAARVIELRAARGAELNLGAMGWREGGGDTAAVAIVEWTLPLIEHGKRESSVAVAALAEAEQFERGAMLDAEAERLRLIHEVVHTEEVLRATEGALLRTAQRLEDFQRKRLEAREGTSQDWVLARRAVLRASIEAAHARANHALARFRAREALAPTAGSSPQGAP
jgi:outer membrane protein TolC